MSRKLRETKTCGTCGLEFTEVPSELVKGETEIGLWFDCPCGSTLLEMSEEYESMLDEEGDNNG